MTEGGEGGMREKVREGREGDESEGGGRDVREGWEERYKTNTYTYTAIGEGRDYGQTELTVK